MADRVNGAYFPDYVMRVAPTLGAAAKQIQQASQAPYEIALASCLAAISAASQGVIDIATPYGKRIPAAVAIVLEALSGERKTSVLEAVMGPLKEFDKRLARDFEIKFQEFRAAHALWQSKRKIIESSIKSKQKNHESCNEDSWELEEHLKREPKKPIAFQLLYKDVSPKAMLEGMGQFGLAALISSEGGEILDGKVFEVIPNLNTALSGDILSIVRVGKPAINVYEPRLTVCLMIQPGILDLQSKKKGELLRDSGHWARYIVFRPISTQGTRFSYKASISSEHIGAFKCRLNEILSLLYDKIISNDQQRDLVNFSPMAAKAWVKNADQIEAEIVPGGEYERSPDHASKLAEHIARIAGLVHFFEGHEGDISEDTEELAAEICRISSSAYQEMFCPPAEELVDAEALWGCVQRWLHEGRSFVQWSWAMPRVPKPMRNASRFARAVDELEARGYLRVFYDDTKTRYLILDSSYMPAVHSRYPSPAFRTPPPHAYPVFKPVMQSKGGQEEGDVQ